MGKQLDTKRTIKVIDEVSYVRLDSIEDPKYIGNATAETYKTSMVTGCTNAFQYDNIEVVSENQDFTIVITEMSVIETKSLKTVEDVDSEFNGQTYYLHKCEVTATAQLYKGNQLELLETITVSADKEEKVKNNRNLGDLVTGDNKDNNTYRHKELSDLVFQDVADKCGRRIEAETSSTLHRLMKKGKV